MGIAAPHSWLACAGPKATPLPLPGAALGREVSLWLASRAGESSKTSYPMGRRPASLRALRRGIPREVGGGGPLWMLSQDVKEAFTGLQWEGRSGWVGVGWNSPGGNKRERGSGSQRWKAGTLPPASWRCLRVAVQTALLARSPLPRLSLEDPLSHILLVWKNRSQYPGPWEGAWAHLPWPAAASRPPGESPASSL